MDNSPYLYLYIYGMVRRDLNGGNIVNIVQLRAWISRVVKIPRWHHNNIIKEMLAMGLLERINRDNFKLNTSINYKCPTDSLKNPLWIIL